MTGSGREREFIDALNIIYANVDSVPYANRAHDYTAAMAHLAERNRNDLECQVFYALALIATASPTDKTHANEKKAADLLEPLFRQHPERKLMSSAAAEEDAVEKHPVTPGAIVPAHEQFGDLLLESNHAPEAAAEVERALSMAPQRRGALLGMSRARELGAAEKRE